MRVIVDTSVWSRALRREGNPNDPYAAKLSDVIRHGHSVVLVGVVLQEALSGIRSTADFDRVKEKLSRFPMLTLKRDCFVAAARLRNHCRSNGVQASAVDFQIAAACIEHDCALLTCDKDFEHIAKHCPLQLL